MNQWIDWTALWEILVVGLLCGAGLPALFAIGMRAIALPARGHQEDSNAVFGGNPLEVAFAALCFLIVLAAVAYGIYIIVKSGHAH
jgi:hypothetical protein